MCPLEGVVSPHCAVNIKTKRKLPVAAGVMCHVGCAHLQVLQVSFLGVTQQRGDAVVLPDAAAAAVPPQGKDLPDHRHPAQRAVAQFQDLRVADLLQRRRQSEAFF